MNGHAANGHAAGTALNGTGFLSFNSHPPRLYITSEDEEFDEITIQHWRDEGLDVRYVPMGSFRGKEFAKVISSWSTNLKLGESYAIIAYGDAATQCLDVAVKPMAHCCSLICYYPSKIPYPNQRYPSSINLVVHLAESQGLTAGFPTYVYRGVQDGFAERDLDMYDTVAASLAWTRSLVSIRKGFKQSIDLESVKDNFVLLLDQKNPNVQNAVASFTEDPEVDFVPTGTGGIGRRALLHFYKDFFIPGRPPSLQTRLVSRTTGADRVVDEMVVSFKHTQEIPWILPGVPPTNKQVQIAIVSIVAIRGGKIVHEHVYWDQASVLAQIGALDPKNVPKELASKGCKRLPVMAAEAAKKILNTGSVPSNDLIPNW